MLKRWIDEVLIYGWAYGERSALRGKIWVHAVSVGAREEEYRREGNRRYTVAEFMVPYERTAAFCGAEYQAPFLSYAGGIVSDDEIRASCGALARWLDPLIG
jgi:glutathione-regulated potassium-efflux system ancillary protein KefG